MKTVRLQNDKVVEIIPESATVPSVEHWYGADFASQCVAAPDEVQQRWLYDPIANTFSEPVQAVAQVPEPTVEDRLSAAEEALLALMGVTADV